MIHKEGNVSILIGLIFCLSVLTLSRMLAPANAILFSLLLLGSVILMGLLLQFFRNPKRKLYKNETQIIAPADGKVVVIEETEELEYLKDKRIQISIFMSPFNVHVNRNPVSGLVAYFKYHPGKFLVAWHPKSSTDNERTTIVYKLQNGVNILLRQIAGAMARRIVYYISEGSVVNQGEQMGFIKFGSRVDVFLPPGTKILVKLDDAVVSGQTVLAELQ